MKRGFTLIELLVVVAIIAALASLLMSAVPLVRDQASTMACASQLRQLGIACEGYSGDNDGEYPAALNNPNFFLWRRTFTGLPNGLGALLPEYIDSDVGIVCPNFNLVNGSGTFPSRAAYSQKGAGYRYNGNPYLDNTGNSFTVRDLRYHIGNGFPIGPSRFKTLGGAPSAIAGGRVVLAFDCVTENTAPKGVLHPHPRDLTTRPWGALPLVRGGNVLFCDGHVVFLQGFNWRSESGTMTSGAYYCPTAGY